MVGGIFTEITAEDLKMIDNSVKYRKQLLREEYESKQWQLAAKWILKKKRVANLEKWRSTKKMEFSAKNRAHRQQVQFRLDKIKTIEFYKKLNMEINFKHTNKKTVTNISNLKRSKLAEKRERELSRYWKIFNAQKFEIANEKTLIDNCTKNKVKEKIISTENVVDDIEQNFSKHYFKTLNIPIANTQHTDGVKTFGHDFNRTFVDRIEKLKKNFDTHKQGIVFLEKSQSVWNKMTQCLVEKSSPPVSESILEIKYEDERPKLSHDVFTSKEDSISLLQILYNDTATEINYNMSDNSVIEMVKRAKSLLDSDATAADVIHLTRCIIEDESDVNTNVNSVVYSLIERSVFEFSKIQIAKRIFSHARKSIDRLQHVNDDDLIPKSLIKSKNKEEVASVVHELIVNDEVYGRFDQPTDDEPDYGALVSETAAERMHRVVHGDGEPELQLTSSLFPMNERRELLEIVDQTVTSFLDTVNCIIAVFVSTNQVDKFAEVRYVRSKITMMVAYRIGRKITKLMFGIFPTEKRRLYNVEKAYSLFRGLVVDRTPRVVYEYNKHVTKPKRVEIDLSYFQRLLENSNPRNRGTSSIKV